MEGLISFLLLVVAAALVLYRLKDSRGGLKDGFEKVMDFAKGSAVGLAAVGAVCVFFLWLGIEALFLAGPGSTMAS